MDYEDFDATDAFYEVIDLMAKAEHIHTAATRLHRTIEFTNYWPAILTSRDVKDARNYLADVSQHKIDLKKSVARLRERCAENLQDKQKEMEHVDFVVATPELDDMGTPYYQRSCREIIAEQVERTNRVLDELCKIEMLLDHILD